MRTKGIKTSLPLSYKEFVKLTQNKIKMEELFNLTKEEFDNNYKDWKAEERDNLYRLINSYAPVYLGCKENFTILYS